MLITDDSKDLIREEPQDRIILDDESLESTLLSNKDLISPKVNVTGGIPDRVVEFKLEEGETLVSDVRVPLLELKPRITEISEPKIQDIGVDEKVDFVVDSIMESLLNEINDNMIPPKQEDYQPQMQVMMVPQRKLAYESDRGIGTDLGVIEYYLKDVI